MAGFSKKLSPFHSRLLMLIAAQTHQILANNYTPLVQIQSEKSADIPTTTDRNEKEGKQVNLERHRMSLEATSRFDQWYYLPLISAREKIL